MALGGLLLFFTLAAPGCQEHAASPAPAPAAAPLGPGLVARAGTQSVSASTVERIAAASGASPKAALDAALRDTLFSEQARRLGLDADAEVAAGVNAALARAVLGGLLADANAAGEVTDDELRDATAFRWLSLDRPEGFRAVHAVVRLDDKSDDPTRRRAATLADALRRAAEAARPEAALRADGTPALEQSGADPLAAAFEQATRAVPSGGLEVLVEALPPVAADGRVLDGSNGQLHPAFARAAAELETRGALAPPLETPFGIHVILLLERIPALRVPADERRVRVRDDVVAARAAAAHRELLERLRKQHGASSADDAAIDALLATVPIGR